MKKFFALLVLALCLPVFAQTIAAPPPTEVLVNGARYRLVSAPNAGTFTIGGTTYQTSEPWGLGASKQPAALPVEKKMDYMQNMPVVSETEPTRLKVGSPNVTVMAAYDTPGGVEVLLYVNPRFVQQGKHIRALTGSGMQTYSIPIDSGPGYQVDSSGWVTYYPHSGR